MVLLEALVQIIFDELDPVWLMGTWDGNRDTTRDMNEILHLL
jgi:hypothetical protein